MEKIKNLGLFQKIALFCLLAVVLAVGVWFHAYYNRKSNDNLPALATILKWMKQM